MEPTKNIDDRELRARNTRSFLAGGFFAAIVVATVVYVQKFAPDAEGIASPLRTSHELNEQVARAIYSQSRRSVEKPAPPKGKRPRVNGELGVKGEVDYANYRVTVESGDKTMSLSIPEIRAMPRTQTATDFKCIEGWSEVIQYAGVTFYDFLQATGTGRKADGTYYRFVGLETPDEEYYVSIDMESMLAPQTILAYEMNQDELSLPNGFPLRLIIPNKYGIKSLKRIGKILFSDTRPPDYWA
ncbi:MAG: molybdopterin-dependent oxidoreductase, partial [Bdellovibrionota bacterium]